MRLSHFLKAVPIVFVSDLLPQPFCLLFTVQSRWENPIRANLLPHHCLSHFRPPPSLTPFPSLFSSFPFDPIQLTPTKGLSPSFTSSAHLLVLLYPL